MILLYLHRDNLCLAQAEARSLCAQVCYSSDRILIGKTGIGYVGRLAYTEMALELLAQAELRTLRSALEKVSWRKIRGSYAVRAKDMEISEKSLADKVYVHMRHCMVDLKNPDSLLVFVGSGRRVFLGKLVWKNPKLYLERKAHKRPGFHPSSLSPKVARACVNLLGRAVTAVTDPFCGTCGILIEAGLMGLGICGWDIDKHMLELGRMNLRHFGLNASMEQRDATGYRRFGYVVTDLPYGRNTRNIEDGLYSRFLRARFKKAVVAFPQLPGLSRLIGAHGHEICQDFSVRLHRSLTKRIFVFRTP